jgi:hypothetical protein
MFTLFYARRSQWLAGFFCVVREDSERALEIGKEFVA